MANFLFKEKGLYIESDIENDLLMDDIVSIPNSVGDLLGNTRIDDELGVYQSVWPEIYKDDFKAYFLNERVGFDACKFRVKISDIDEEIFDEAVINYKRDNYKKLPRVRTTIVDTGTRGIELPFSSEKNKHFSMIEVTCSSYLSFTFRKNNANKGNNPYKSDIFLMEIMVRPEGKHRVLGNIFNYSYDEMAQRIIDAVDTLYALTGILIDIDNIILSDIELNMTFRQHCKFDDLRRCLTFYQRELNGFYKSSVFNYQGDKRIYQDSTVVNSEAMLFSGYRTASKSVVMTLYDKALETKNAALNIDMDESKDKRNYRKTKRNKLFFEDDNALIRLEFEIKEYKEIQRYFGTTLFWQLSQEKIEDCFCKLVERFFVDTYEKYCLRRKRIIKTIAKEIGNPHKYSKYSNFEWKVELVRMILSEELFTNAGPAVISAKDIVDELLEQPRFNKNKKYYRKVITEIIEKKCMFDIKSDKIYKNFANFIAKTYRLQTLSERRRIGYIVENERTRKVEREISLMY